MIPDGALTRNPGADFDVALAALRAARGGTDKDQWPVLDRAAATAFLEANGASAWIVLRQISVGRTAQCLRLDDRATRTWWHQRLKERGQFYRLDQGR